VRREKKFSNVFLAFARAHARKHPRALALRQSRALAKRGLQGDAGGSGGTDFAAGNIFVVTVSHSWCSFTLFSQWGAKQRGMTQQHAVYTRIYCNIDIKWRTYRQSAAGCKEE
jgi:hypothetical protein